MKIAVFGLGNFGANLAINLQQMGHEVVGIDQRMERVEELKDQLTYVVCLDTTIANSMNTLPLKDVDLAIVCIGENEGDSLMTTALLKQMRTRRIISRAISPLHRIVLESIGVEEIVNPEKESAERLAYRLSFKRIIDAFEISDDYTIAEITADEFAGKTIQEAQLKNQYRLNVITIIRKATHTNLLGLTRTTKQVLGVVNAETIIEKGDILVVFGAKKDVQQFLKESE
ncbi:MAG: potassium transporter [Chitinophagales bacterium]|nr:MAG: potassium transporter [Chitinophagales bacterium]